MTQELSPYKVMTSLILIISLSTCSLFNKFDMKNKNTSEDKIAAKLTEAGFSGLFQYGKHSLCDSIWQDGKNEKFLISIISNAKYNDYTRLLACEVLYAKTNEYPPLILEDTLAYIYSQALKISGSQEGALLSGNLWGFMYFTDKNNVKNYGILGNHLLGTGEKALPYLASLLTNSNELYYEGSQDATLGNSLKYRVKDAAAYYISKITGIPVQYYENHTDRDAEIERLKDKLK